MRPFVWVACLGVATTAVNIALPMLAGAVSPESADPFRSARQPVLLVHAVATLLPMIALALSGYRHAPFAAVSAVAFTAIEKATELLGQVLLLFPPEETFSGVAAREVTAAVWDQMFFALWLCNTLGAAAAGWLMFRLLKGPGGWLAACAAWLAAGCTLLLLLGPDYVDAAVPGVPAVVFLVAFTGYRVAIAYVLWRSTLPLLDR
jgi:hypothetical protein